MAAITWYMETGAGGAWMPLNTAGQVAATSSTGWTVGTAGTFSSAMYAGVQRAANTFSDDVPPDGSLDAANFDAMRSPAALSGDFANANWVFQFAVRSLTNPGAADGRMVIRIIKANADGSSPTEIAAGQHACGTVTDVVDTADSNSTLTLNPGAFSVSNQYIFIQVAWQRTGAGGMSTTNIRLRTGVDATPTGTVIVTSDFTPAAATGGGPLVGGGLTKGALIRGGRLVGG